MATQTVHYTTMALTDHLPILQILIPFIAAPLIVFIGRRELAWAIAFIASAASFVVACLLLSQVIGGGIVSYHIGDGLLLSASNIALMQQMLLYFF